jgi:hypothetical protein
MADVFTSGTAGRVRVGAGPTVVAGITKWTRRTTANIIPIPHFETAANSDSVLNPTHLLGLGGPHTIACEGYLNSDATNITDGATVKIRMGVSLTIDLLVTRVPLGFIGLTATVTSVTIEVVVENQPARFSMEATINGDPENLAAS